MEGRPVEYNAQAEAMRRETLPGVAPIKVTVTDPGDMLLRPYDRDIVRTDLTRWMTFLKKDRIKKVERYAERKSPLYDGGVFPDKASADDARRRYLLLIMHREVLHGDGSPEVALAAFTALFPPKG